MNPQALQRLLYVEDDPDIRIVAELALVQVGGLELCSCSGGAEALEKITDFKPQMILLDVMMPNMDGPQTLEKIRQLDDYSDTPVVFITAKVQPHEVQQLMALGAVAVVSKPFKPMEIADELRTIWENNR